MIKSSIATIKVFLRSYSTLIFLDSVYAGAILFLLTFLNYSVAISGIVAIGSALLFAYLIGLKEEFLLRGFYIYNSLLAGMGIGYIFSPSLLSLGFVAILSIFTFLLSFMLNRVMGNYGIPILSLPFSIVTIFSYLASLKYSTFFSTIINKANLIDLDLPLVLSGFLKSLGTIFFLPNNIAGIVIILILLYYSRIMFLVSIIGFYVGVYIHSLFIGSLNQALSDIYAFNYIITAIALCGVFLLPTIRNFIISLIGVIVAVILSDAMSIFFNYYAITVFTIPFNITVIVFIFVLYLVGYKEFNYYPLSTPEYSLSNYLSNIFRFATNKIKISLPFSGEWDVYQGFNGSWTHKGDWRYAYDFVIKKDDKTYTNLGHFLEDYYCYGESILSPISGYVVSCRHDLVDNTIGVVDKQNNWGNYIIIKGDNGIFVEISHLMQYSLSVDVGDYVKVGDIIAKCGNSGYSPQPHIHIQVQKFGVLGSVTLPFCFSEFIKDDKVVLNDIPKENEKVKSIITNKYFFEKLSFFIDEVYRYDVFIDEKLVKEYKFVVKMNEFGEFYFEDDDGNRLFFYTQNTQFYCYNYIGDDSYLKEIFKLIPRVFFTTKQILYSDYLSSNIVDNRVKKIIYQLLSVANKNFFIRRYEYRLVNSKVVSKLGEVSFDTYKKGFEEIKFKNIRLRRKEDEKN